LKLTEIEFWMLTPLELDALIKRHLFAEEKEDFRTALVACTFANVFRGKKQRALKPADFMPGGRKKRKPWQEQLKFVELLNAAFGGKDERKKEACR